jgi:hypothetical protein
MLLSLVFGCNKNESPTSTTDISGEYQYLRYDLQNNVVSTGNLKIVVNGNEISGTKDLSGNDGENGNGEIAGSIDNNGNISINLNPNSAYQIILKGNRPNGLISGDRLGDTGTKTHEIKEGTFKASKI